MAFTLAGSHGTASSSAYNELAGYFNGSGSVPANPLKLITFSDSTQPVLVMKNLDTTNGQVWQALKADGTILAEVHKTGFRFSPDGTAAGLVPVSISGTETITGAKTFSAALVASSTLGVSGALTASSTLGVTGVATLGSSLVSTPAGNTASASGLTLPAGRYIPITLTNTITSIVAGTAGREVVLVFATAGCTVKAAAISGANGDYISTAGGTLTLWSDGSNWHESGRSGGSVPGARYRLSAATTSIVSGAERTVTWTATDYNYGMTAASTSAPVPGILGRWRVELIISRDGTAISDINAWIQKNGSDLYKVVGQDISNTVTGGAMHCASTTFEVSSITDTYGLGLTSGNTADILGGVDGTSLTFTYQGR